MKRTVDVQVAREADDALVDALTRLLPQLNSELHAPSREALEAVLREPCTRLLLARRSGSDEILGALTLVIYRTTCAVHARIEDVIVDTAARGAGVGNALLAAALERARDAGADVVELTSHPTREAANRLYRRLGFEPHETNAYRFFPGDSPHR